MYDSQIDLSRYYSKQDIQKKTGKNAQQIWRLETYHNFPKSILVKVNGRTKWIRPAKAFFLKTEVDEWFEKNSHLA